MTDNVKQLGHAERSDERTGLVLSGGAARGAYEMGVVSVLVPALERRGGAPEDHRGNERWRDERRTPSGRGAARVGERH